MEINDNFIKKYTRKDVNYQYHTMVNHKGTIIAFAMDDQRHIYYSVLNLADTKKNSPLDVNYWLENPSELRFTNEIVEVGYADIPPTLMPLVKKGSEEEALPEEGLREEEIDSFLSSTARLTALAPSRIISTSIFFVSLLMENTQIKFL